MWIKSTKMISNLMSSNCTIAVSTWPSFPQTLLSIQSVGLGLRTSLMGPVLQPSTIIFFRDAAINLSLHFCPRHLSPSKMEEKMAQDIKEEAKDDGSGELVEVTHLPPPDPMPLDEFGEPIDLRIPAGLKMPEKSSSDILGAFQKLHVGFRQISFVTITVL